MEAVNEDGAGYDIQERFYLDVAKGYTRFQENDLLWAKITPCMENGKAAVIRDLNFGVGFGSTEFHVLRAKSEEVNIDFIHYVLAIDELKKAAQGTFSGTAGQQRVPKEFLRDLPLPLPPLEAQRILVANMEAARQQRQEKLAEAQALLDGIDAFVLESLGLEVDTEQKETFFATRLGKTQVERFDPHFHHPIFRKLQEVLQGTPHKRLGKIVKFSTATWNPKDDEREVFPYVEISGVQIETGKITPSIIPVQDAPSRARILVQQNDILISTTRPHRGAIGILEETSEQTIASTGFSVIRSIKDEKLSRNYLLAILRSQLSLQQMLQRSSGGNYPAITQKELEKILIPVPTQDVQEKIANERETCLVKANQLRTEAEMLWQAAKAEFEKALLG